MRVTLLLSSLSLAIFCSTAAVAAPVFELNDSVVDDHQPLAVDADASNVTRMDSDNSLQARLGSQVTDSALVAHAVFNKMGKQNKSRLGANVISVAYSPTADTGSGPGQAVSSPNTSNDLLFNFLQNFEVKPQQNPGRWTLLLMGLCFVLVQVRRRSRRASISLNSAL